MSDTQTRPSLTGNAIRLLRLNHSIKLAKRTLTHLREWGMAERAARQARTVKELRLQRNALLNEMDAEAAFTPTDSLDQELAEPSQDGEIISSTFDQDGRRYFEVIDRAIGGGA